MNVMTDFNSTVVIPEDFILANDSLKLSIDGCNSIILVYGKKNTTGVV